MSAGQRALWLLETNSFIGRLAPIGYDPALILGGPMSAAWFPARVAQVRVPPRSPRDIGSLDHLAAPPKKKGAAAPGATGPTFGLAPRSTTVISMHRTVSSLKVVLPKADAGALDQLWKAKRPHHRCVRAQQMRYNFAAAGHDAD